MAYNVWETCLLVPGFSRGECASWVQAIGSIAAVVGTLVVMRIQIAHATAQQRERENKTSSERLFALLDPLVQANGRCVTALKGMSSNARHLAAHFSDLIKEAEAILNGIPVYGYPSAKIIVPLSNLKATFGEAEVVALRYVEKSMPDDEIAKAAEAAQEEWIKAYKALTSALVTELAQLMPAEERERNLARNRSEARVATQTK